MIDDAGPYLTGKADRFATEVSLVDNKRLAEDVLAELVGTKMTGLVERLPRCTSAAQLRDAVNQARQGLGLPSCIPAGVPTEQLLERLGIDVIGQVQSSVLGLVPDKINFTDAQLRSALSLAGAGANLDQVDTVREILRDGWTYTQDDLKQDLREQADDREQGDELVETMEDVRAFLADGWTFTEVDLREKLSGDEPVTEPLKGLFFAPETSTDILDISRNWLKFVRDNRLVAYLPLIVLLVIIAFLGGRGWSGRVVWGAAFLLVSAGLVFAAFGPGYNTFAKTGPIYDAAGVSDLDGLRAEALSEISETDYPETSGLVANKVFDIIESLGDGFSAGIARSSLSLAIIALVAIVGGIFWAVIVATVRGLLPRRGG